MAYCVEWRLLGRSERLLDYGTVGDTYSTFGHAAAAVSELLQAYSDAVRSEDGTHWCARRSADADIELRIWISDLTRQEVVAANETTRSVPLRSSRDHLPPAHEVKASGLPGPEKGS